MLSREENERFTRVGPGTPCGEMMRRYWWPVGFADEIKGPRPRKVKLLGEEFVLFRDGTGAIGMLDILCARPNEVVAKTELMDTLWPDTHVDEANLSKLVFVVREPYVSRHSKAGIVAGMIESKLELILESQMPSGGVIFSDGVEADALDFNSGARARIRAAARKTHLVAN